MGLFERGRGVSHADEDQPCVRFTGHRRESGSVANHGLLKGFLIGDGAQLPVIAKAPAVEGADKDFLVASLFG